MYSSWIANSAGSYFGGKGTNIFYHLVLTKDVFSEYIFYQDQIDDIGLVPHYMATAICAII